MANAEILTPVDEVAEFGDELAPGTTLMHGNYTIEAFLNAGGFGITYVARDNLDQRVVIKECFPGSFCRRSKAMVNARSRAHTQELASIVDLFMQEARSLAKLEHPNIVRVHSVFEDNNTAYMALDYVEGRDLLSLIDKGEASLTPDQVESLLRQLLDAIGYIHKQGVLHRDVSPDNILLKNEMDPILIDFGAAREEATKQSHVLSALRVVKDGYSPQELYVSGSAQGPYSDLYALGATFYHLIVGEVPPNSQVRLSAVAAGEDDPYQALEGRFPAHRKELLKTVDKALNILPQNRIESAEAWLDMLDGKVIPMSAGKAETPSKKTAPKGEAEKPKSKRAVLLASAAMIGGIAVFLAQGQLTGGAAPEAVAVAETPAESAAPAPVLGAFDVPVLGAEEAPAQSNDDAAGANDLAAIPALAGPAPTDQADAIPTPVVPSADDVMAAIADDAAPSVPVLGVDTAPSTPAVAPVEVNTVESGTEPTGLRGMLAGWSVELPSDFGFDAGFGDKRIQSVNGIAVGSRPEFERALRTSFDTPNAADIDIEVAVGPTAADAKVESLSVPIVFKNVFPNGYAFETVREGDAWLTQTIAIPRGGAGDIEVGDVLVGDLTGQVRFDTRSSFPATVEDAILNGERSMMVAIKRDGAMTIAALPLP